MANSLPEEMVSSIDRLCENLTSRAEQTSELRRVPEETIQEIKDAGLFRLLQPKKYGGYEVDPKVFYDVQIKLSEACPSTGWVYGVVGCHAWQLALFAPEAQEDVWAKDQNVLVSSSYSPVGKVTPVDGGYRISGKWSFSSGSDHCEWAFLGGLIFQEGNPRPDYRTFLINREYYEIQDDWFTSGLRGSGSKTIVVKDAFIPETHTHRAMDGFAAKNPGNAVNSSPIYKLPFGQVFVRSISSPAIGAAKGALNAFLNYNRSRITSTTRASAALDPAVQSIAATANSEIDAAVLKMHRNFDELSEYVASGEDIPMERRYQFRFDSADAVGRCTDIVQKLFQASGGRAVYLSSPINRYFQDIHTIRAHVSNNPVPLGQNYGAFLMGQTPTDMFI